MKFLINLIIENLDKIAAIFFIVFGLIFFFIFQNKVLFSIIGLLILVSGLLYILLRKRAVIIENFQFCEIKRLFIINTVFFYTLLCIDIFIYYFNFNQYYRPTIFFILVVLMSISVIIDIYYAPPNGIVFSLVKIILISLFLEATQLFLFPGMLGGDAWFHQMFTEKMIAYSQIPINYSYSVFPLMHILVSYFCIITNVSFKLGSFFSVSMIFSICNILVIYCIGKTLFNERIALIISLVLATANLHIHMGFWVIPNAFASVFLLMIIYLMLKISNDGLKGNRFRKIAFICVLILLMTAVIISHSLTGLVVSLILLLLIAGNYTYKKFYQFESNVSLLAVLFLVYTISLLVWWTYLSSTLGPFVQLTSWGFDIDKVIQLPTGMVRYAYQVPLTEQILSEMGMFLLFGFSFIGVFYLLKKNNSPNRFYIAIIGITLLSLGFFPYLLHLSIVEDRWWFFAELILVIPAGISFFILSSISVKKTAQVGTMIVFIALLLFLSILNYSANLDNKLLNPESGVRYPYYSSELTAARTNLQYAEKNIFTDKNFAQELAFVYYDYPKKVQIKPLYIPLKEGNFSLISSQSTLVIRDEITKNAFELSGGPYRLTYDLYKKLDGTDFSKIYDSPTVQSFYS